MGDPRVTAEDEELARLCKALAHPARARIVRILATERACVCGDFVVDLSLAQSTVSQHLKILRDAGVVVVGERGRYQVDRTVLDRIRSLLDF